MTVWLVGAGPGDPGLITARGLDLVRSCEALVYDVLVAPELDQGFADLDVEWVPREYDRGDLDDAFLVIAATSERSVNERISGDAERRGMLCNVADVPDLCNFILPAVHREGPIAVAVSTGGASPALAKRLRARIAEVVRPEHAELAEELRALRPEVRERFATYEERRDYFEELVTERLG